MSKFKIGYTAVPAVSARTKIIQNSSQKKSINTKCVHVLLKNCRHIWVGPNNNELLIDLICQRATGVTIQLWSDYMADPMSLLEFSSIDFVTLCDQIESPCFAASVLWAHAQKWTHFSCCQRKNIYENKTNS